MVKSRDPGGKLSLFDVLTLAAAGGGAILGFQVGYRSFGLPLGTVGAAAGLLLGFVLARATTALMFHRFIRQLQRTDTTALRGRLENEYFISHLIIGILRARGEPEVELRDHTLRLLLSSSVDERWHGWRTLNLCFPEMAERLAAINPVRPTSTDDNQIRELLGTQPAPQSGAV